MKTLRQIVAGTDFSDAAEQALELALELAFAARAQLTLVHVCEPGVDDLDDQRLLQGDEALSRVVVRHQRRGVEVTGVLRAGKPWEKLDNVAVEVGAGLIVIGRHGAGRGRSVELGSVAGHLIRSGGRPVLLAACDFDRLDSEGGAPTSPV